MKNIICLGIVMALISSACNTNTKETKPSATEVSQESTENKSKINKTKNNQTSKKKEELVNSGKINWKSIEEVEQLIESQPKKILIDAYTSWCGWCKRMDKNTFQHPEIVKYVNENFYAIKFDAETKETINFRGKDYNFVPGGRKGHNELAKFWLKGRLSYPTISFLNEKLDLINAFPGYLAPDKFDVLLNYINNNEFAQMGYTQYKSTFTSKIPPLAKNNTTSTIRKTTPTIKKVKVQPGQGNNNVSIKNTIKRSGNLKVQPKSGN